jgi:hypothetical protein
VSVLSMRAFRDILCFFVDSGSLIWGVKGINTSSGSQVQNPVMYNK